MTDVGVFLAVAAGSLALLWLAAGTWQPGRARVRRRLAGEFGPAPAAGPNPLYKDRDRLTEEDGEPAAGDGPRRGWAAGARQRVTDLLRQAGSTLTPRPFFGLVAATALLLAAGGLATGRLPLAVVGAGGGAGVPFLILGLMRKARRQKYQKQLVGAFELMSRVLRAGQSVPEAFRAATEAADTPLAAEFGRCLHQMEHGIRPDVAYRELSDRSGVLEMRIFTVAMAVQRQTGGNLSEVLDRLAGVVRARVRVRQKIRALTAEGRLQSVTLTVLPVLTFAVMYALNRQYAETLLVRWQLLVATAACMTLGLVWIRAVTNFEG